MAPKATVHKAGCVCVTAKKRGQVRSQPFEATDAVEARRLVVADVPEGIVVTIATCAKEA